jgi:hypothetical protein
MSKLFVDQVDPKTATTLTLGTSGDTISIPSGVTLNSAGTNTLTGIDNTPSFGATASSTQSIGNGGWVKVTLNSEDWDTDSAFDSSTNYRFTVPSGEGGKYLFNYGGYLVSMTTNGYFQLQLYKNGAELRESAFRAYMSTSATSSMNITSSICVSLAAADYIEFYVIQDNPDGSGGTRTLSNADYKPFLTGMKVLGA